MNKYGTLIKGTKEDKILEGRKLHCKLVIMTLDHTKYLNISYAKPSLFFLVLFISTENENIHWQARSNEPQIHYMPNSHDHFMFPNNPPLHLHILEHAHGRNKHTERAIEKQTNIDLVKVSLTLLSLWLSQLQWSRFPLKYQLTDPLHVHFQHQDNGKEFALGSLLFFTSPVTIIHSHCSLFTFPHHLMYFPT